MIYLDHAATSHPKPPAVSEAVLAYLSRAGNPGRSGHQLARLAEEVIWGAREVVADFFSTSDPARVVFTNNATAALNVAIKGLARPGTRVITSSFEHNSVTRPLNALPEAAWLPIRPGVESPIDLDALEDELRQGDVSLVVASHASNVTGAVIPVGEIRSLTAHYGIPLVLDAAQTAGHTPIHSRDADVIIFAGHKALFGPQGTGGLIVGENITIRPLMQGGTGGRSEAPNHPRWLPYSLEAGTPNGLGIAGLAAALRWLATHDFQQIIECEQRLRGLLMSRLDELERIEVHEMPSAAPVMPVVSVSVPGLAPVDAAASLEEEYQILVRAGLHCAPLAHRTLNTFPQGTIRFSLSHQTTEADIEAATVALDEVSRKGR